MSLSVLSKDLGSSSFSEITGAKYAPYLEFSSLFLMRRIRKKCETLKEKGQLDLNQHWLEAYFKKEIVSQTVPDVSLQWIDSRIGWGVFAQKDFKEMEFIAEYTGIVRKRRRSDAMNSYCFEYLLSPSEPTRYVIDARDQGGISRFINHSDRPNLMSALALVDSIPHIVIYTARAVKKGEELRYDYGPDYWKRRARPI